MPARTLSWRHSLYFRRQQCRLPMLRRKNHEIWDRFENGPPTAPNEDVHTHHIKKPYVISRREIAREAVPRLTDEEADQIARLTFRYSAAEVTAAATRYATTRELPNSPFKPRVCAIEPRTYMYIEELI